jgi:hypothetical protein
VIKTLEAQVGQFLLGYKCRVNRFFPGLAKEETVLQGMNDRLIEIGRCYGVEMNVEKPRQ